MKNVRFYRYLTYIVLLIIPFFPVQIDKRIYYILFSYCLVLLPVFLKELWIKLKTKDLMTYLYLIFLGAEGISTYFSYDRWLSFWTLGLYICSFIVFTVSRKIFTDQKSGNILFVLFIVVSFGLSLISFYNTFVLNYVNREVEGEGFMWIYLGHNHLGALLVFALPVAGYLIKKNWRILPGRLTYTAIFSFLVLSLLTTYSRGANVALVFSALSTAFLFKLLPRKLLLGITIASVICMVILLNNFSFLSKQINHDRQGWSISARDIYWRRSFLTGLRHPVFGLGLNTTRHTFRFFPLGKRFRSYYAHNFILQMFSDAGVLGLLSSVLLIGVVFIKAYRKVLGAIKNHAQETNLQIALFIGLLATLALSLVDYNLQIPIIWILFWLLSGILLGSFSKHKT